MKKILTASLVAIMAVTAANADIASTKYVDSAKSAAFADAKGYADNLNTAMDTRVDSLETDNRANKDDISQLKEDVSGLAGDGTGSVGSQIDTAIDELVSTGQVGTNTANIATLNGDASTPGSVAKAVADAKTELQANIDDKADKATTLAGYGITDAYTTAQADGKFQTEANILTTTELNETTILSEERYVSAAAADKIAQDAVGVLTDGIANMDADKSAQTGYVMTGVEQEDGKITAIKEAQITNAYIADGAAIAKAKLANDVQTSLTAADNAMQLAALKNDASWTTAGCATAGVICSLVSNGGNLAWEKVVDSASAAE